ncbi:MAG: tRNA pseudouridine(38-40) synthase TruA [bacterium]
MINYLIVLEYDGSNYHGWQIQNNVSARIDKIELKTISGELLKAIKKITGIDVELFVSGRTDAGVHALNQVANFKLPFLIDLHKLKSSLNGVLPPNDISVKNIELAHNSFHSTFDTVSKTYLYKLNNGFKSALLSKYSWYIKDSLNLDLMKEAAKMFIGNYNFINFAKSDKKKDIEDYFRTVIKINIEKKNYGFNIYIEGEGFLRHMVRRIIGAIVLCGSGKINIKNINHLLNKGKTPSNIIKAPPEGLFLYSIKYNHKLFC